MNGIDLSSMPSLKAMETKPSIATSAEGMSFDFGALNAASEGERVLSAQEEWLKERHGKFTASEIYRLLAITPDGSLSKGAETYCLEKAAESLTEFDPDGFYPSKAIQWGNEQEPFAVERFTQDMMMLIESTNEDQQFINSPDRTWGGTPDGVSPEGLDYGLEIKCPNSTTHMTYRTEIKCGGTLKLIKPVYYWQVQASMYLCEKTMWYFMSFDPRFDKKREHQSHIVEIQRNDDDIEYMLEKIQLANTYRDMLIAEMG